MNIAKHSFYFLIVLVFIFYTPSVLGKGASQWFDSERHLSIDKVQKGMTGYGLSIFSGTTIERFDVKIVDVIYNFEPKRNAILVELTGQDLERTGVVAGMSGSPVYLQDSEDGKYKIIGAVAFGWNFGIAGPAICGVQPIEEMMDISPEKSTDQILVRSDSDFISSALQFLASEGRTLRPLQEFNRFSWIGLREEPSNFAGSRLAHQNRSTTGLYPLSTPLSVSGVSSRTFQKLASFLEPLNLSLVKTGGIGSGMIDEAGIMEPAGVMAVPLAMGDVNLSAVGTVTEVLGDHVWGFGHSFFSQGPMELPMSSGVVHAIIPNQQVSFKLGSPFQPTGTLYSDQATGVAGKLGTVPKMAPFTIQLKRDGKVEEYRYQLAMHEQMAPLLAMVCAHSTIFCNKELPELHEIRYAGEIEFEEFGTIRFANVSSNNSVGMLLADLVEPINLMMNNPHKRVKFERIDLSVEITPKSNQATIMQAKMDRPFYRPGQQARVDLLLSRVREPELVHTLYFTVPDDLPDGEYNMTIGGMSNAMMSDRRSNPHLYKPTSIEDTFELIKRAQGFRSDHFYITLRTQEQGFGVRRYSMNHLPGSKLQQLQQANPGLTSRFSIERLYALPSDYVISGQEQLKLIVSRNQ